MRVALVALALAGLGGVDGCGGAATDSASKRSSSDQSIVFVAPTASALARMRRDEEDDDQGMPTPPPNAVYDADADVDNDQRDRLPSFYDGDESPTLSYGHAPSTPDARALSALAERYYRVAAAGDGAAACSLLATSFAKSVRQDYGSGSAGPAYLSADRTCPAVMTALFRHDHGELVGETTIVGERVAGREGYVLIGSVNRAAGALAVKREAGRWRVDGLLSSPLP